MRVLQVHYIDKANDMHGGGGAIAMYRLHNALINGGVDSKILCWHKTLNSSESVEIPRLSKSVYRLESGLRKLTARFGLNDIHCLSTFNIRGIPDYSNANILNIHCIHGGFFNYLMLPMLTRDKPAVFTLHDMWPYTGHCAFSYGCDRWKSGCGKCPHPNVYPPINRDATNLEWRLKDLIYSRSNLAIVTPSTWLTKQAQQSMLNRFMIQQIPNGIDMEIYKPLDPEQCRSLLGIPPGKKVLMFASLDLNDYRKGGDLLMKALQSLPKALKSETILLLVGKGDKEIAASAGIQTLALGYVSSDRLKAIAYSAADLFLHPTRADNLPLVLQESMACGTPMISFNVGGVPDLVRQNTTGHLVEPENADSLCKSIVQLLEEESLRIYMRGLCREIALREYSLKLQAQRYVDLYRKLSRD